MVEWLQVKETRQHQHKKNVVKHRFLPRFPHCKPTRRPPAFSKQTRLHARKCLRQADGFLKGITP